MIFKKEAKKEIERLVRKYENLPKSRLKKISEADTGRVFIMPLLRALGWDVFNDFSSNEVIQEETTISGRIDYSFRLNNITQFILEAKAIPEDLDKEKWARQAIEYGWNKGIPWVVLSDFEGLKVFNSDWKKEHPEPNLEFKYGEYIKRFDRLWLLSKESFEKGKLDKLLSEFGIKAKRISVNEKLAEDLLKWREFLTNNLKAWNKDKSEEIIEESVQRILDRLIFIRVVEDRKLEERKLWQTFQKWVSNDHNPQNFLDLLVPIFRDFDGKYNSNLFIEHVCEKLFTTFDPFNKIIPDLYADKEKGVKYRFDAIDVDVLGNVYEQYLGYVQGREGGKGKRKEQGIYYTPTYIVDYLVQNTLGKSLEERSLAEIESIKVLDPACGSGSFLIKAFGVLNEKIKKERFQNDLAKAAFRKYNILTNNIYGVDLDSEAVEIARLNLLLKALEPNHKLPMLTDNIKMGNSLISDKKLSKQAFDWKSEFLDSFKDGSFDVIVGNPPYIFARGKSFSKSEKDYYYDNYELAQYQLNTYLLFIEKAFNLLKEDGFLGFIVPNTWLTIDTFSELRKFLLNETRDLQIINIYDPVFGDASVDTCILIFRKGKPNNVALGELKEGEFKSVGKFNPKLFKSNNCVINISLMKDKSKIDILQQIDKKSVPFDKYATVSTGLKAYQVGKGKPSQTEDIKNKRVFHADKKKNKTYKKYLDGRDVMRYGLGWSGEYLSYGEWLAEPRKSVPFKGPRILVRQIPSPPPYSINAIYIEEECLNDINSMVIFDFKENPLYLLAVLNSKLTTFWFTNRFDKFQRKTFPQFKVKELKIFPVPNAEKKDKKELSKLARKMIILKRKLSEISENTDHKRKLQEEIKKLDKKIDQMIYKLYNLTPEEIEIVEGET